VPVALIRTAIATGLNVFGENRVDEAEQKASALPDARWQLVGRLQSNKAARAAALFELIHSVDSLALAERLERLVAGNRHQPLAIYLQVNVDDDPAKAGFDQAELTVAMPRLAELAGLELRGLMTIGRLTADATAARPTFRRLRELSERLREVEPRLGPGLSMGMTDDFEAAVEEGATVVRIGRALFGERPA
jgi:pyridoxal phosphate enzyme (YggS family)